MFAAAGLISLQKMTLRYPLYPPLPPFTTTLLPFWHIFISFFVFRLEEDHETARLIAKSIENLGSLGVSLSATDTNMVFFKLASNSNPTNSNRYTNSKNNDVNNVTKADLLVEKLSKRGVLIGGADEVRLIPSSISDNLSSLFPAPPTPSPFCICFLDNIWNYSILEGWVSPGDALLGEPGARQGVSPPLGRVPPRAEVSLKPLPHSSLLDQYTFLEKCQISHSFERF